MRFGCISPDRSTNVLPKIPFEVVTHVLAYVYFAVHRVRDAIDMHNPPSYHITYELAGIPHPPQ
jgi:uncharacterized membrane protein